MKQIKRIKELLEILFLTVIEYKITEIIIGILEHIEVI